ncbi:MAG TPA: rRNA maturation RNase YbeY [Dehalococcoidia bacterium]|nr:rRNA maturation RNase YbeY [Dehalococcoidia bacterium]
MAVTLPAGGAGRLTPGMLRRVARAVMRAERVSTEVGVEVALAGSDSVRELNRLYRGRDEPTDVLSFAAAESAVAFPETPGEAPSLGEVVVCLEVAEEQARAAGNPVEAEAAHLVVHGLLHILGYDHEDVAGAERMQAREDELLRGLGYAGQFSHGH